MNKALFFTVFVFASHNLFAQEFETYKNGLIYSEATMTKLERIVDSLNLKYKTCDFNKVFYSKSQTIGHYVTLSKENIKEARKDMDNNMPFELFVQRYPNVTIDKNLLIIKDEYEDYNNKNVIEFRAVDLDGRYGKGLERQEFDGTNSWIYHYSERTDYTAESITAFYLLKHFNSIPLNSKYNLQIGYSDCLIDTTTTKILKGAEEGWEIFLPKGWQKFNIKQKEKLLNKMRSTEVIGRCSQDMSPRLHAMNIALLSAETTNWEVFLKSHLDIMNDRFDRLIDGSYAWAGRKTYIKELEELDINVTDLLLGISLRVENPATNHYYGSIGRLGRAIAESKDKKNFEAQILSMIEDNELDDYNRVIAYFLFLNYNHYLEDKTAQKVNLARLKHSVGKLPEYISGKIKLEEQPDSGKEEIKK